MATQAIEQAPETAAADTPQKGGRSVLILAVAGLAAGAAAGLFGIGPVLAQKRAAMPAPPPKVVEVPSTAVNHPIENLVLNPAGSNGTRFLMVTATFEVKDAAADALMKDHEAEVRDHLLAMLGKKTVDQLTDITQRDGIKTEAMDAVAPLFPKGTVLKVFFPQFVIQ
ncbi:MAG TPA: flagellar basal body-associated FliL family protein [Gemmatimonadaceae bacterium]|jgi:flagellar FliL protein